MEKITGIVFAYDTHGEYDQVKDMGIGWIRMGVPFPFADKVGGELTEGYKWERENIRTAFAAGMKIMPVMPGLGGYCFIKEEGRTRWRDEYPDFVGVKGTDEYYDNLRETAGFVARDLAPYVSDVWQIMNEIDIDTFRGDYSMLVAADTCRALAEGVIAANPRAVCGTNLAGVNDNALVQADLVYRPGHVFGYIGDDQYFGSWQNYGVEKWSEYIGILYDRYKLPVLVNEWGYSSGGVTLAERPDPKDVPLGWPDVCYSHAWFHEAEGGHTEEAQAEYIAKGLDIFQNDDRVLGSFLFCFKDAKHCYHCGQTECPAECFWGVVDNDNKPKKAYYAIKEKLTGGK